MTDDFTSIEEIVKIVQRFIQNEKPFERKWEREKFGNSIWGVWGEKHETSIRDSNGIAYPLAIYSMIRWTGGKNPTPTLWKTIEWRDTNLRKAPSIDEAMKLLRPLANELSRTLEKVPLPWSIAPAKSNGEIDFLHVVPNVSKPGKSQSAVRCKIPWLDKFVIQRKGVGWGMKGSMPDFVAVFTEFALWGSDEITEIIAKLSK